MAMSLKRWSWRTGIAAVLVALPAVVYGCGSDDDEGTPPNGGGGGAAGDAGADVSQDGATDGQNVDVKPDCELVGATCASHGDCCSANCDPATNICTVPVAPCKGAGESCAAPTECCTMVCSGGKCGADVCISDNQPCTAGDQCCSGKCEAADGGEQGCVPLNPNCATAGNECQEHDDCCSHYCDNGRCSGHPSFCTQTGDTCVSDAECCGGVCRRDDGATLGLCVTPSAPGATGCTVAGEVCGAGAEEVDGGLPLCGGECCSRSCAPHWGTGVLVCQPPSGCRPTGEACRTDADCCGGVGTPEDRGVNCRRANAADAVGRCSNPNGCRPAGAVCKLDVSSCNAEANCCAGNTEQVPEACQQDLLGIPRCTGVGECSDTQSYGGLPCSSSADCCGLPCLPNAAPNGAPFVCGESCVPKGGACTTDADCCAGLPCALQPGSTKGVCGFVAPPDGGVPDGGVPDADIPDGPDCALYGQECTTEGDCCNDVPCTNGRCLYPVY